ncbi:unnamed protein product [Aphanomyces euteiches]
MDPCGLSRLLEHPLASLSLQNSLGLMKFILAFFVPAIALATDISSDLPKEQRVLTETDMKETKHLRQVSDKKKQEWGLWGLGRCGGCGLWGFGGCGCGFGGWGW